MTKLSALLAAGLVASGSAGLVASGSAALAQPLSHRIAQDVSSESDVTETNVPESSVPESDVPETDITQFLSDSAPAECSLQVTSVTSEESDQSAEDILSAVPLVPCEAVSGTDDGNSKNFNFLNLSGSNFYKVITSSEPVVNAEDETYQFSVKGVKVVPLDEAGNAVSLAEVEYLFPADEQVCTADAVEQPRSVICDFEVIEADNVLVGQLKYVW